MQQDIHTERPIETSRIRVAKIVLFSVFGLCLLNVLLCFHLKNQPIDVGHFLINRKWEMLLDSGPTDIIVLGDSTAAFSIEPEVLQQQTGLRCMNLATVGGVLVHNDAWMLETYIKKWGAPRAVVIVHEGIVWEAPKFTAEYLASVPIDFGPGSETKSRIALPRSERWRAFSSEYLTLYSRHTSLARLLRKGPGGPVVELSSGGFPIQPEGSFTPFFPANSISRGRINEDRNFAISSVNLRALRAIQLLCRANRCPLVFAKAPIFEDIAKQDGFSRYDEDIQAYFDEYIRTDPNSVYIFRKPFIFNRDEGNDDVHLNPKGAERYTRELAEELKRQSEGRPAE